MRPEVLEVIADELVARAAPPIASFLIVEDGRPRLCGMRTGRRWDLDREQDWNVRAHDRKVAVEIRRLMKMRARHKKPEVYRAHSRQYEAANKARRREQRIAGYWKNRPVMLAKMKAYRDKNRARVRADGLRRYYADRERRLVYMREYGKRRKKR